MNPVIAQAAATVDMPVWLLQAAIVLVTSIIGALVVRQLNDIKDEIKILRERSHDHANKIASLQAKNDKR